MDATSVIHRSRRFMNKKLKKQLVIAVLILVGIFVAFAIVGQVA